MATKLQKRKNIFKIISSETIRNIGLRFCRNIFCISLYKCCVFHCYCSKAQVCSCRRLIMGKIEKWQFFLSHCRYFDKTASEMFLEWSSTRQMTAAEPRFLIVAMATKSKKKKKKNNRKNILRNHLLRNHMEHRAEILPKYCLYER